MDIYDIIAEFEKKGLYKHAKDLNKVAWSIFRKKDEPIININELKKIRKQLEDSAERLTKTKNLNELERYIHSPQREKDEEIWWTQTRFIPEPRTDKATIQGILDKFEQAHSVKKIAKKIYFLSNKVASLNLHKEANNLKIAFIEYLEKEARDVNEHFYLPSLEEIFEQVENSKKRDEIVRAYDSYEIVIDEAHKVIKSFISKFRALMRKYDRKKDIDEEEMDRFINEKVELIRNTDASLNRIFREMKKYLIRN